MELDEWFWRTKTSKREMSDALGIHIQTIFSMVRKDHTPALFTCLAIQKYTKGKVSLEEMLGDKDLVRLKMIKGLSLPIDDPVQN